MSDGQKQLPQDHKSITQQLPVWLPLLLFCLAAGLLSTLWGYNYSSGNAEEQLPFIYRALNSNFLTQDFFTNTFSQYGPRTFYSGFVALFASWMPLTSVLFLLTYFANAAIAFLSAVISGHFFPQSRFSRYLAAAGVLTLKTFWLGYSNILYRNYLEPEHLAMPLILLGFFLILKKRPSLAALSFGVAAIFHALLGLELGWILIGLALLNEVIQKLFRQNSLLGFKRLAFACLILVGFSAALLYPYTQQTSIAAQEFIRLVAYVRHPHHYLPSYFEPWQWGQAGVYLLGFGFAFWFALKRSAALRDQQRYLYLIGAAIVLLCLGGYLFVEVWPSRLWTSAQMFRLPYLIKWFSLVLLTGWVGDVLERPAKDEDHLFGLAAGLALVTPASLAVVALAAWVRRVILPRLKWPGKILNNRVILILALTAVAVYKPELRTWGCYLILFCALWTFATLKYKPSGFAAALALPLAASAAFFLFATVITPPSFLKYEIPVFSLYKTTGELAEVANYAKANTEEDAVFFVPPTMGEFRYAADRAIVVDFSAFPFQDSSMEEWYQRIVDCYGVPEQLGFDALPQLNEKVYYQTKGNLIALSQKYGFRYAIIYDSTNINLPVIYHTKSLKLIELPAQ